MSFCTACGCARTGANLYCDGCGAEFGEPEPREVPGTDPLRPAEAHSGPWASWFSTPRSFAGASGPLPFGSTTRPDLGVGLLDSLLAPPDPAGDGWADVPVAGPRHRSPGRHHWLAVVAVALVIVAGLGGAAAFELSHGHGRTAGLRDGSGAAHARTPRPALSLASGHGGTDVTVASGVGSGVGSAARPQVVALLDRYFSAINQHDYAAYADLLDPQALLRSPASVFYSGDGSTTDSGETLTGLADLSSGGVAAAVTFTSHQQPADSPDHSACDAWSITLYLVPQGNGYLIGLPPAGYEASYTSC
jgi:hypothetical protein